MAPYFRRLRVLGTPLHPIRPRALHPAQPPRLLRLGCAAQAEPRFHDPSGAVPAFACRYHLQGSERSTVTFAAKLTNDLNSFQTKNRNRGGRRSQSHQCSQTESHDSESHILVIIGRNACSVADRTSRARTTGQHVLGMDTKTIDHDHASASIIPLGFCVPVFLVGPAAWCRGFRLATVPTLPRRQTSGGSLV